MVTDYSIGMRTSDSNDDVIKLIPSEQKILDAVKATFTNEDRLLSLLRDLRAERHLEFQIYSSREQWFWIPWTVLLAGTLAAISSASTLTAFVVPPLTAACARELCFLRRPGLDESLRALNQRHKWTYWLTDRDALHPSAQMFGFAFRTSTEADEVFDRGHMVGFSYPVNTIRFTTLVWGLLWAAGIVRFWNSAESYPLKRWLGWA